MVRQGPPVSCDKTQKDTHPLSTHLSFAVRKERAGQRDAITYYTYYGGTTSVMLLLAPEVSYQANITNILCFLLFQCENLLLFAVLNNS